MLRIGVAGAGNIASIAQLPTLVARDDVELRGLVTRKDDPQPLMQRWGFRRAYPTVEALLAMFPAPATPMRSTPALVTRARPRRASCGARARSP